MSQTRKRILIGKIGLDGHDRGAKIVARTLKDAGFEVIYTGLHQTPESVARAAVQEAVDAIGVSILSGAHNRLFADLMEALKSHDAEDILVLGGGVIPTEDIPGLKELGVSEIFLPGSRSEDYLNYLNEALGE